MTFSYVDWGQVKIGYVVEVVQLDWIFQIFDSLTDATDFNQKQSPIRVKNGILRLLMDDSINFLQALKKSLLVEKSCWNCKILSFSH